MSARRTYVDMDLSTMNLHYSQDTIVFDCNSCNEFNKNVMVELNKEQIIDLIKHLQENLHTLKGVE